MVIAPPELLVCDDVLPDPHAYRAACLAQPFGSIAVGPTTFHGLAQPPDDALLAWVQERHPWVQPRLSFLRASPAGQVEPNYVHDDRDMGTWTGILYLNPAPPQGDGTTFWAHRVTHTIADTSRDLEVRAGVLDDWRDPGQWTARHTITAKFNRLIVFPSAYFHSRALAENYGDTPGGARLIQVLFGGDPTWP